WPVIVLALLDVRLPSGWSLDGLRMVLRTMRRRLPRLGWVVLPLLVVAAGELALNAAIYGDPLARLAAAAGHGDVLAAGTNAEEYQGRRRRWYLSRIWWILYETPEGVWLVGAVVALGLGTFVAFRRLWFPLAWAAFLYVPLVLLGG